MGWGGIGGGLLSGSTERCRKSGSGASGLRGLRAASAAQLSDFTTLLSGGPLSGGSHYAGVSSGVSDSTAEGRRVSTTVPKTGGVSILAERVDAIEAIRCVHNWKECQEYMEHMRHSGVFLVLRLLFPSRLPQY